MTYHKLIDTKEEFPIIIIILVCSPDEGFLMDCLALSPRGGGKRLSSTPKQRSWNPSRAHCSALIIYLDFKYLRNLQKAENKGRSAMILDSRCSLMSCCADGHSLHLMLLLSPS